MTHLVWLHWYHLWGNFCIEKSVTSISHGTRKYPRRLQTSGKGLRGTFQTKFKPHAVWKALRKLLKRLICTRSETSGTGTSAAVYTVVYQASGVNQGLLAAKSRLVKKGLTIPRLDLVSAHIAANLAENVKNTLWETSVKRDKSGRDSSFIWPLKDSSKSGVGCSVVT